MKTVSLEIRLAAEREIREELRRKAIDAEKLRIMQRRTFWSRIEALLPFTITRKSK